MACDVKLTWPQLAILLNTELGCQLQDVSWRKKFARLKKNMSSVPDTPLEDDMEDGIFKTFCKL